MNLLEVINLSCKRGNKVIFENLNVKLAEKQLLLVQGPNGSGKSSLLQLLCGLSLPTQGEVHWHGKKGDMHYLSHHNGLKVGLTVAENLLLTSRLQYQTQFLFPDELTFLADRFIHSLSAGQKRRVALAKLTLWSKKLWLLDEPLTALDEAAQQRFLLILNEHLANNGMAVISSHHAISLSGIDIQHLELSS